MKSARRIATLATAIAAPLAVFGLLYVLRVQPERAAAAQAREHLAVAQTLVNRDGLFVAPVAAVGEGSAFEELGAHTVERDAGEVAGALTRLLNSPEVGGVSNLSIEIGASSGEPIESVVGLLSRQVMHTRITIAFDAPYEKIRRFFLNLRVLPGAFDLQSLELTPGPGAALMHAAASLLVFHSHQAEPPKRATESQVVAGVIAPEPKRDQVATATGRGAAPAPAAAAGPDLVVSSILISGGRRVALVDGRVVRPGDRVRGDVVHSIESHAVIVGPAGGRARRLEIGRAVNGMTGR